MRASIFLVAAVGLSQFGQAADTNPLSLDGIAHVALRVRDVAVSREFYQKLGFEQAFEFNDAAGTTVSYMKVNDRQFIELYRRDKSEQPIGLMHICFDGSDIERVRQAYVERGLQPTSTVKARAGNLLFTMKDPEGQLLEYTQYLPGSLHSNARGKFQSDDRIARHLVGAATAVKDLRAEAEFYRAKIGFEGRGDGVTVRLRVPGTPSEAIELEPAAADWKPRIEFSVADVSQAAAGLRARGLSVRLSGAAAVVTDPDGTTVSLTSNSKDAAEQILDLERRAIEGWQRGDPGPLLAILDPEITYFHAVTARRLDGLAAVRELFESYRGTPLFDSFEMVNPKVQISGDVAVLTYLFERRHGGVITHRNATQVYRRNPEGWRVLHTHWSMNRL